MKSTSATPSITPPQAGAFRLSHHPLSALLLFSLFLSLGCPNAPAKPDVDTAKRPLEGVKLRLAVADDPALAAAIQRLCGEWNVQTGAEFDVEETTADALVGAEALSTDAVVCPSHWLGVLAERGLLAAVPSKTLKDPVWGGVFELLRVRESAWGTQTVAVPFGSPVFCCYYRADLLEKLGRRPPKTWAEYDELAKLLAAEKPAGDAPWSGVIEPLAPGWPGVMLLARAAPYAKHRENYSTLFNVDSMEPQIAGPPFVQALEDLVAVAKLAPGDPFQFDPAAARAAFWKGQCGMAITWPTAAEQATAAKQDEPEKTPSADIRVGFVELPGVHRVFNLSNRQWDRRTDEDDPRVPLLGVAGRLGVVNRQSAQVDAAFQLLLWLSDDRTSPQVSPASPATTLFRTSHLKSPTVWVEKAIPATAALDYADATEAALRHEQWLAALPIPGRAKYLAALDEAVAKTVRGEKSALDALLEAEGEWRKITEELGLDRQKAAYRHSLGID